MTFMRAFALLTALASAGLLTNMPGLAAGAAGATVRLKSITTRVHAKGASLVIEATEPVPYLTSRPDPLTVIVDLRNVGNDEVSNLTGALNAIKSSPIAHVAVENAESMGSPVSRVRVELAEPFVHRVRSDKNTIVVDFEKLSAQQAPFVLPPASRAAPDAMLALESATTAKQVAATVALAADLAPAMSVRAASSTRDVPTTPQFQTAPATQTPAPTPSQAVGATRVYSGHPVSLDFQGADLRAVLRTFAEISGLNMVIDPAVQGSVDVALREVPWDQALDLILRANKLGYGVDGSIVRIAPLTVLADEEGQRRKLAEEQALAGDLRVLTRTLSYAKAADLQALITRSTLSQRGTVQVDVRTNTLIITDLQERLNTASDLINTLDRARAAGGDRGAHRADQQELREGARRPVGLRRAEWTRRSETRRTWPSRTAGASPVASEVSRGPAVRRPASTLAPAPRPAPSASRSDRSTERSTSTSRSARSSRPATGGSCPPRASRRSTTSRRR